MHRETKHFRDIADRLLRLPEILDSPCGANLVEYCTECKAFERQPAVNGTAADTEFDGNLFDAAIAGPERREHHAPNPFRERLVGSRKHGVQVDVCIVDNARVRPGWNKIQIPAIADDSIEIMTIGYRVAKDAQACSGLPWGAVRQADPTCAPTWAKQFAQHTGECA
ncbi:hypothetical protein GCM10027081_00730 [Cupriavidus yeoncheonensis]